jgi:hypothetical protein
VDVAADDLETRMFDRERIGASGERHDVVVVERELGQKPSGWAVRPEHCELHEFVLSTGPATRWRRVH